MEHLEVFGGREQVYKEVSSFVNVALNHLEVVCTHEQREVFLDGSGYCVECGLSFDKEEDVKTADTRTCQHINRYEDASGLYVCRDCKAEIDVMNFDQEWKYYSDCGVASKDPSRCHKIKPSGKSIEKVFQELPFEVPQAIIVHVEKKYNKIIGDQTIRGDRRKAIIAACLLFTYREFGQHRTSDFIKNMFGLTKKKMSSGLISYYESFPEARTLSEKPHDLLRWILSLAGIEECHYRKTLYICKYVEESSVILKRASPQSVASAAVYFYLCINPVLKEKLGLTKNKFAEKVLLSDITVSKLLQEVTRISQIFEGVAIQTVAPKHEELAVLCKNMQNKEMPMDKVLAGRLESVAAFIQG